MNDDSGDLVPSSWLDDDDDSGGSSDNDVTVAADEATSATLAALAAAARSKEPAVEEVSTAKPEFDLASLAGRSKMKPNKEAATATQSTTEKTATPEQNTGKKLEAKPKQPSANATKKPQPSANATKKPQPTANTTKKPQPTPNTTEPQPNATKKPQPKKEPAKKPAPAAHPPKSRALSPLLFAGLGAVLLVGLGLVAWLVFRGGSSDPALTQPEVVSGVTLNIDDCGLGGATATISNQSNEAMEFDAGIDFVDDDDTPLYPVRIAVNLEAGATRTVEVPFGGASPTGSIRCVGTLRNVAPMP